MARKKIVFIIVEGPSDDTALGVLFTKIFDENHVHVEITHGDKQNSSNEEKENDSYAFAKAYKNDIPGFLKFISESSFSVEDDYLGSWKYIQADNHSLERHTNLGLCFKGLKLQENETKSAGQI